MKATINIKRATNSFPVLEEGHWYICVAHTGVTELCICAQVASMEYSLVGVQNGNRWFGPYSLEQLSKVAHADCSSITPAKVTINAE